MTDAPGGTSDSAQAPVPTPGTALPPGSAHQSGSAPNAVEPVPDAVELARLDAEIRALTARAVQAHQAFQAADAHLRATQLRRDELARRVWAPPRPRLAPPPVPARPSERAAALSRPETSTRTAQNVLFILGGLLLGTAAVVFTAVAWASFGQVGRAAILAVVTALALGAPLIGLRRGLTATAETFAGLGLLLIILDGYAAWFVNLFGVRSMPGERYAGLVCAVTAAVAVGYRALTRLVGPSFAAVLAVQPVLPLMVAPWQPNAAGWSIVAAGVGMLNLLVIWRTPHGATQHGATQHGATRHGAAQHGAAPPIAAQWHGVRRGIGWVLHASALVASGCAALWAQTQADTGVEAAWAGAAVLAVAAVLAAGAASTRSAAFQTLAGCVVVLATVAGAVRFVAIVWPEHTLVLAAVVVAAAAAAASAGARLLPAPVRSGPIAGAMVAAGGLGAVLVVLTLWVARETIARALPMWHAALATDARFDWQLLAAIGLVSVALRPVALRTVAVVEPLRLLSYLRHDAIVGGGVLAVLALPGCVDLPWWAPSVVDLTAAAVLAVAAVVARPALVRDLGAAVLTAHAVLTGLARPESTAAILGGLALLGVAIGVASQRRSTVESAALIASGEDAALIASGDDARAYRRAVGGMATLVGLAALPPAVGATLVAVDVVPSWVGRLTAATVVLVLAALVAVHRWWPDLTWYAFGATLGSAVIWPTVVAVSRDEPTGIYAAFELLAIAAALLVVTAGRRHREHTTTATAVVALAAAPGALLLAIDVVPAALTVVALPYTWVGAIWSGVPAGVGLAPPAEVTGEPFVTGVHAVALSILAVASATAAYAVRRRIRSALGGLGIGGPIAILVALVAAGAPWPSVPGVTLLLGLCITVLAAVARIGRWRTTIATTQGLIYVGAGIAGTLTVEWATLVGLGSTVVAAAVVGAAGRTVVWRVWGWLTAVAAALATAAAAGLAADLRPRDAAFGVLAAAVVALAVGAALRGRGEAEAAAVQAGAHAGAVVALLFTVGPVRYGSVGHAAAVSTLWGVAVGLRALWSGTSAGGRVALAALAAGWELLAWWLLLALRDVAIVEAYTLPLAGVALLAGWAALRARPELRSWAAYGPALCAAFLPSLATILTTGGEPWRRLLLGAGALAVVVAGSVRRRQAPVVVGGVVLGMVALHEVVLAWDLLPRWIPLAVGGALLVGLAMTYERRSRDLARLRDAIGQMR